MKTLILSAALLATALSPALAQNLSVNPANVEAGTYKLDPAHGKITWSLSHLGFSTYTGQFSDVNATLKLDPTMLSKTTLNATVGIASIGTLNPKLDSELTGEKFFNTAKFPTASFVSTKIVRTSTKTASVYGNLTMLGVTKPEVLLVTFNQSGTSPVVKDYEVGFEGKAVIQRSQFGLSAYVPYVGDQVTLDLEGEFHLQP